MSCLSPSSKLLTNVIVTRRRATTTSSRDRGDHKNNNDNNNNNDNRQVLLGYKKRGWGIHKYNGFGGKVEAGETISQAACRELQEESGLSVKPECLSHCGLLLQTFQYQPLPFEIHLFTVSRSHCGGEERETDEMKPQWFDVADIPFDRMWVDDKQWYRVLLAEHHFIARYHFQNEEQMSRGHIEIVDEKAISEFNRDVENWNYELLPSICDGELAHDPHR